MDRTPPAAKSDEIELYIRTYYSLLRSTGPVRIRSLEDTHMGMRSNLHHLADRPDIDVSALVYSALRLPEEIVDAHLVVMGQMEDAISSNTGEPSKRAPGDASITTTTRRIRWPPSSPA